jgi:hypothetical protein
MKTMLACAAGPRAAGGGLEHAYRDIDYCDFWFVFKNIRQSLGVLNRGNSVAVPRHDPAALTSRQFQRESFMNFIMRAPLRCARDSTPPREARV